MRIKKGYGVMVAVTIGADGVLTNTELGDTVAAFAEPTKKYVVLTESLGPLCRKYGIQATTSGRVGRGYFSPAVTGNYGNPPPSPACVFMIQWIDAKNSDTVANTFKDMLVKDRKPWCLVLDPGESIPEYARLDFQLAMGTILDLCAFFEYVSTNGKHRYYIEQIEGLLVLLRRIATVDTTDARRSDWEALYIALEPLLYYVNSEVKSRYLLVENPDVEDDTHYMIGTSRPKPMERCEKEIRISFKNFCEAIGRYQDARQQNRNAESPVWDYNNLLWKIYDVPKCARVQRSGFEGPEDPQGLREFFQKCNPEFNDAMFVAALVINFDPTEPILYYEHVLKKLHSIKPYDGLHQEAERDLKFELQKYDTHDGPRAQGTQVSSLLAQLHKQIEGL
jgi:hypothetical protein